MNFRASDIIACDDARLAGRIVYWALNGTVEHESFKEACIAAGLPEHLLPYPPTSDRALKRSLDSFFESSKLVARAIKKVPGYSLFRETQQPTKVRLTPELSVYVRETGGILPALVFSPDDHPLCKEIRRRFISAIMEMDAVGVSAWLNKVIVEVSAISLRPMGGFYFVPRPEVPKWNAYLEPLRATSHHAFYSIPALSTDDVVQAVLDGLTAEAEKVAQEMSDELDMGSLGPRALKARVARCDEMASKFGIYEGVVNSKLDKLREVFGSLQAQASTMILLSQEDKENE